MRHAGAVRFSTSVSATGGATTGLEVPAEVVDALGGGRRPRVVVTLNGYRYRTSIGVVGGRSLLPVSAEVRQRAGVAAGDAVEVEVEVDDAPRVVEVPEDLAAALAAEPGTAEAFAALSPSARQRLVLAVEGAKAPATRARRVAATVEGLRPR